MIWNPVYPTPLSNLQSTLAGSRHDLWRASGPRVYCIEHYQHITCCIIFYTLYYILSYDVIIVHMIVYYIMTYHAVLHYIILYYIILYYIISRARPAAPMPLVRSRKNSPGFYVYMYVYIHIYIYIYVYTYVCVYTYIYIYIYVPFADARCRREGFRWRPRNLQMTRSSLAPKGVI